MLAFESESMLVNDREDLIQVMRMRFGEIPGELIEGIYEIDDFHTLQRLILAAANAMNWQRFIEEFNADKNAYRLVGESFNPLADRMDGRNHHDGAEKK